MRKIPVPALSEPLVPWWYNELRMSSGNKSVTVEDAIAEVEHKLSPNEVEQKPSLSADSPRPIRRELPSRIGVVAQTVGTDLPTISVKIMVDHFSDKLTEPWIIAMQEKEAKRQKLIAEGLLDPDDSSDDGIDVIANNDDEVEQHSLSDLWMAELEEKRIKHQKLMLNG